jgi:hypothetical protein
LIHYLMCIWNSVVLVQRAVCGNLIHTNQMKWYIFLTHKWSTHFKKLLKKIAIWSV